MLAEKDIVSLADVEPTQASVSYSGVTLPPSLTLGASSSIREEITRFKSSHVEMLFFDVFVIRVTVVSKTAIELISKVVTRPT